MLADERLSQPRPCAGPREEGKVGIERTTLAIYGLTCGGGGALTVERSLARTPGVARVYVNPLTEIAYVEFDPAITDPTHLARAVHRVGFRTDEPGPR
jgi:Cu+-exporting ATPase